MEVLFIRKPSSIWTASFQRASCSFGRLAWSLCWDYSPYKTNCSAAQSKDDVSLFILMISLSLSFIMTYQCLICIHVTPLRSKGPREQVSSDLSINEKHCLLFIPRMSDQREAWVKHYGRICSDGISLGQNQQNR